MQQKKEKTPIDLQKYKTIFSDEELQNIVNKINNVSQDAERDIKLQEVKALTLFLLYFMKDKETVSESIADTLTTLKSKNRKIELPSSAEYKTAREKLNKAPHKNYHELVLQLHKEAPEKFQNAMKEISTIYFNEIQKKNFSIPADFDFRKAFVADDDKPEDSNNLEEVLTKKLEPIIETYFKRIQNG